MFLRTLMNRLGCGLMEPLKTERTFRGWCWILNYCWEFWQPKPRRRLNNQKRSDWTLRVSCQRNSILFPHVVHGFVLLLACFGDVAFILEKQFPKFSTKQNLEHTTDSLFRTHFSFKGREGGLVLNFLANMSHPASLSHPMFVSLTLCLRQRKGDDRAPFAGLEKDVLSLPCNQFSHSVSHVGLLHSENLNVQTKTKYSDACVRRIYIIYIYILRLHYVLVIMRRFISLCHATELEISWEFLVKETRFYFLT